MNIYKKLREKRESLGWSLDDVVEKLLKKNMDINKSSLSRIENGQRQKIDSFLLGALSELYNYNFFELMGYNLPKGNVRTVNEEILKLPILAKVSAGTGYMNFESSGKSILMIKNGFDPNCYLVEVEGDSMEPTIPDGSFIVVDPRYNEIENGKIYVVNYQDESYIKKVYYKPDLNIVILKSINPKYEDIFIKEGCFEYLEIKGRALQYVLNGSL